MKKKMINIIKVLGITALAALLFACGNVKPKSDRVVTDQTKDNEESVTLFDTESFISETNDNPNEQPGTVVSESTSEVTSESASEVSGNTDNAIDIDLTTLSSTMVYSEVYNMMYLPDNYVGKTIRMMGMFMVYTNLDETQYYPAVIVADATACCSQGIEFVLEGDKKYPEDYPELETDITVVGTFETYYEDGIVYCRLKDAIIE